MKVYTPEEYRKLDLDKETGFNLLQNPNQNYYRTRRKASTNQQYEILMAVNHITAGLKDFTPPDTSAESTTQYGMTTSVKVSWHNCLDSDSLLPGLPDTHTAWAQGVSGFEFNRTALALEIGTREPNWDAKPQWWVDAVIRNAAIWWAPRFIKYEMPVVYKTNRNEINTLLKAGRPVGFTDHYVLAPGIRVDPGYHNGKNTFPRQMLIEYTKEEISKRKGVSNPGRSGNVFFLGAVGADVRKWQVELRRLGYLDHAPTGNFLKLTDTATREFQRVHGLTVDGRVGPASQNTMKGALSLLSNRISGTDRYKTAIAVSKAAYPAGAPTAYLIAGDALVDGIPASTLAGPKLLVRPGSDRLPSGLAAELKRLGLTKVVAVGGGVSDAQLHKAQVAAGIISVKR